jgi:hypothetical protein
MMHHAALMYQSKLQSGLNFKNQVPVDIITSSKEGTTFLVTFLKPPQKTLLQELDGLSLLGVALVFFFISVGLLSTCPIKTPLIRVFLDTALATVRSGLL